MSRKLFTVIAIVCIIFMATGCSLFKPKKDTTVPSSADSAAMSDSVEEIPSDAQVERVILSDAEVCEMLCGFYVNKSYFDEIETTKSALHSQSYGESVFVFKDDTTGQYFLMHGDMHQGNKDCALLEVAYDEEKNEYSLSFEPYAKGTETVLTYNDTTKTYVYRGFGTGKYIDEEFIRFGEFYAHREYIAYLLLKDSPDVTVNGQRIYVNVDGGTRYLEISSDVMFDSYEAIQMRDQGALGYAFLRENGVEEYTFYYYFIEGNAMIIKDEASNVLLTLRLSPDPEANSANS